MWAHVECSERNTCQPKTKHLTAGIAGWQICLALVHTWQVLPPKVLPTTKFHHYFHQLLFNINKSFLTLIQRTLPN